PRGDRPLVKPESGHDRLHGTPMGEQRHHEAHGLGRGAQAVKRGAFGGAERLLARVADEPLVLLRMDTDIALARLASSRAVSIGAECGCGVHDAPPGCAWKHCHEEYVWIPIFVTSELHHGLVQSHLLFHCRFLLVISVLSLSR